MVTIMENDCSGICPHTVIDPGVEFRGDFSGEEISPFIHRFQTEDVKYIFDVNTLRIVRVSPIIWDIIEEYGRLTPEQLIDTFRPCYSPGKIREALEKITHLRQQEGIFLSVRPRTISLPPEEMIQNKLKAERGQLILNVTENCNFRCSYCLFGEEYDEFRGHSNKVMPWNIARKAIDEFLAHSGESEIRNISFYGGEPLLNFALIKRCVDYVKKKIDPMNVSFSLTTNGALLHGEVAEYLAKEEFALLVSLDGPRHIHDSQRRTQTGKDTWDTITSNVLRFLSNYPQCRSNGRLRFQSVATSTTDLCSCQSFWEQSNYVTGAAHLQISRKRGKIDDVGAWPADCILDESVKKIHTEFIRNLQSGHYGDEYTTPSMWVQAASFEQSFLLFHKRKAVSSQWSSRLQFLNHCIPGARRVFVDVEGNYFTCERVPLSRGQTIGDVHTGVVPEKVMGLLHQWFQGNDKQCRNCWCLPICTVGCLATLGNEKGISEETKRKACSVHRTNMHHMITDYCRILEKNPSAFDYAKDMEFQ